MRHLAIFFILAFFCGLTAVCSSHLPSAKNEADDVIVRKPHDKTGQATSPDDINHPSTVEYGPNITDIDGNEYSTIIIDEIKWMAENLRVTRYNNEDDIPTGFSDEDWLTDQWTQEGRYAVYPHEHIEGLNSREEVLNVYGALYNGYVLNDDRGICPDGWRMPSIDEWTQMIEYLMQTYGWTNDHQDVEGVANKLKSCRQENSPLGEGCETNEHPRWDAHNTHYGTDDIGFTALPGGARDYDGSFINLGSFGGWYSSTGLSWVHSKSLFGSSGSVSQFQMLRNRGQSLRCVRDVGVVFLNLEASPLNTGVVTGAGEYENGDEVVISATAIQGWEFVNWTGDTEHLDNPDSESTTVTMPAEDVNLVAVFEKTDIEIIHGDGVTDIDGNEYATVVIDSLEWMAENLRVTRYRNGDDIPTGFSDEEWEAYDDGAYIIFGHSGYTDGLTPEEIVEAYGKLYNWYAVDDSRGICPEGWRAPGSDDWTRMEQYICYALGNTDCEDEFPFGFEFGPLGTDEGNALKSCRQEESPLDGECDTSDHPRWSFSDTAYGQDKFGFSGLPGGRRSSFDWTPMGWSGFWWTKDEWSSDHSLNRVIDRNTGTIGRNNGCKYEGLSVRCVRDITTEPSFYNLNLNAAPSNAGTANGAGEYQANDEVNISALANEGWNFLNWSGDADYVHDVFSENTHLIMPESDITIVANFEIKTYEISAQPNDESFGSIIGQGTYEHFEVATLKAIPESGYDFVEWTEDGEVVMDGGEPATATFIFVVEETRDLTAHFSPVTQGENIMKIHDVEAIAGQSITIELEIINEDEFTGFNLDIPLPEGFNYIPGTAELFREDGHFIEFSIVEGNRVRMISAAIPTTPFTGNDGVIVSFDLETPDSEDVYILGIEDAVISDTEGNDIMTGHIPGTVTLEESAIVTFEVTDQAGVSIQNATITLGGVENAPGDYVFEDVDPGTHAYTVEKACHIDKQGEISVGSGHISHTVTLDNHTGDANDDGQVNVSDVIVITNYFMGQEPDPFCFINADVNADGVINVQDVIGTTNIFMTGKAYPHEGLISEQAHIYLYPDGIYLESDGTLTGLQFELKGINPQVFDLETILPNHQLVYKTDQDAHTAMVFSTQNTTIPAKKTQVIAFEEHHQAPEWGDVLVANVNAGKVPVQTHAYNPTGIQGPGTPLEVNLYPNPARESLWVELQHLSNQQADIALINIHGQELVHKQVQQQGRATLEIKLDNVAPGVYLVRIIHQENLILEKIVVE